MIVYSLYCSCSSEWTKKRSCLSCLQYFRIYYLSSLYKPTYLATWRTTSLSVNPGDTFCVHMECVSSAVFYMLGSTTNNSSRECDIPAAHHRWHGVQRLSGLWNEMKTRDVLALHNVIVFQFIAQPCSIGLQDQPKKCSQWWSTLSVSAVLDSKTYSPKPSLYFERNRQLWDAGQCSA